jgi:phosphoribosylamine-glycine ligase
MICADGPKFIEYNVRFGDPKTKPYCRVSKKICLFCCLPVEERLLERQPAYRP